MARKRQPASTVVGTTLAVLIAVALVVGVVGALSGWFLGPVEAQEREIEGEGETARVRIRDGETEDRIDRAVLALLIIAVGLTLLTALFWWHTQPSRRNHEAAARAGPDDTLDVPPGDGPDGPSAGPAEPEVLHGRSG